LIGKRGKRANIPTNYLDRLIQLFGDFVAGEMTWGAMQQLNRSTLGIPVYVSAGILLLLAGLNAQEATKPPAEASAATETAVPLPSKHEKRNVEMSLFPKPGTKRGIITVYTPDEGVGEAAPDDEGEERKSLLAEEWRPEHLSTPSNIDYQLPGLDQIGLVAESPTINIDTIKFEGNTVFTDSEIEEAIREAIGDYREHPLSSEDIEAARIATTKLYIAEGYVNSGALVPDQDLQDGSLTLKIVEGKLSDVRVIRRPRESEIKKLTFSGNVAIPDEDLEVVALEVLQGKTIPLSPNDTAILLRKLSEVYFAQGFRDSGALIPKRSWLGSALAVQIIEGESVETPVESETETDENETTGGNRGITVVETDATLPAAASEEPEEVEVEVITPPSSKFAFEGNEAYSDEELKLAVAEKVELIVESEIRSYTAEEILSAQEAINGFYASEGYVHSGALLPTFNEDEETVTFRIVEGEQKPAKEHKWMRDRFYSKRLKSVSDGTFNMTKVQRRLELLTLSPHVSRINAEVKPTAEQGDAYLQLTVKENFPIQGGIDFHNHRPVSVGSEQIEAWILHQSLLGFGDRLYLTYGLLNGGLDEADYAGFDNYGVEYRVPVTGRDTTIFASYRQSSYTVIQEPFNELDIGGSSSTWHLGIEQPLFRSPRNELIASAQFDRIHSETLVLGIPFSVTPGAIDGEIDISMFRASLDWVTRSRNQVLALRMSGSMGVDWFGLETTDDGTDLDNDFVIGQLQGQYIRRLSGSAPKPSEADDAMDQNEKDRKALLGKLWERDFQLLLKGGLQVTDTELLSPVQWTVGGVNTIRGYRENSIVRDLGYYGSVEFHIPLIQGRSGREIVRLIPFFDVGGAWSGGQDLPADQVDLYSAGLGFLLSPFEHSQLEMYWGHPFTDLGQPNESLQDDGIHFKASLQF
tara:strand:- start:25025 stop:27793 length:2769 start_codon:yes stop_codon:yes gene_type:complete